MTAINLYDVVQAVAVIVSGVLLLGLTLTWWFYKGLR